MEKGKPQKKQATLFQFKGFSKNKGESKFAMDHKPCHCQYCGRSCEHAGARKTHEFWCKERPKNIPNLKESPKIKSTQKEAISESVKNVSLIINDMLKDVIISSSSKLDVELPSNNKRNSTQASKTDEKLAPPIKKTRKSYSFIDKANVVERFISAKKDDPQISLAVFAEQERISKSMLFDWEKNKIEIFKKASEEKVCYFKKGRVSKRHDQTHPKLYHEFVKSRRNGKKISFDWLWVKGRKIADENGYPAFTKSAVQAFLKKYTIKIRKVQRKKQDDKSCHAEKLREWHLKFREGLIKSKSSDPTFDSKWGRFKPHQRINVDQVPLPFVMDKKTTYELPIGHDDKVWIANPGSGLEKRQCTLQVAFSPENNCLRTEIIFRGTGKGIKETEKRAYHKSVDVYFQNNAWADTNFSCDWVNKTLKSAIPEGEEFVLICDNLSAQVSDQFKAAVRSINGIVYFGLPGATDIWQPVDAGYGYLIKKLTAQAQDEWLELDENVDVWMGNDDKKLTASDRRILITQWVGEAADKLQNEKYDNFRWRCFEKTGKIFF